MWMVVNASPFAADRSWVRDRDGRHQFVVAIRGTYTIDGDGRLRVADQQEPVALAPSYQGEDGASSLRWDSDLGQAKPSTDVIVNGHAYAPRPRTTEVTTSLRINGRSKVLSVRGDSVYYLGPAGLTTTAPRSFEQMPLVYERAFGGWDKNPADPAKHRLDPRNPLGRGFAIRSAHLANQPAPNVFYPGKDPTKIGPAGFGAICSHWSPRLELGGTYDQRWETTRKPLLPTDYDERFVSCSPRDQWPEHYLEGGARFELVHLTPDRVLQFELPLTSVSIMTYFGLQGRLSRAPLVTVIIEPDERRVMLVWQSNLPVRSEDVDYLDTAHVQVENPE